MFVECFWSVNDKDLARLIFVFLVILKGEWHFYVLQLVTLIFFFHYDGLVKINLVSS